MKRLPLAFLCLSFIFPLVISVSPTYIHCQLQKSSGESALTGCPKGTLYVSATDSRANFSSVQDAIDSLPEAGKAVILIGEGQYYEMLNITRSAPLVLLGQLDPATAFLRSGSASQRNIVLIWNSRYAESGKVTDEETATLTVAPSLGHPFGNVDFKAYNIDFENRAANYSIAPALAASSTLANTSFYGCSFGSYQDTLFVGFGANSYVVDSTIYGQTDFIFGFGTILLQSVTLALHLPCGGGMVAWQGTPGTRNGAYISDSTIVRSPDADPDVAPGQCYLGRPWNKYAITVFSSSHMDDIVHPTGFTSWDGENAVPATTFYAEFNSHGPGGNTSARIAQDHILSSEQSQVYTLSEVFGGPPRWVDRKYQIL